MAEQEKREEENVEFPPEMKLVMEIAAQNARDLAFATNAVQEHLERRLAEAEATIQIIRSVIWRLLDGDYMPTSGAIERALYPSSESIKTMVELLKEKR